MQPKMAKTSYLLLLQLFVASVAASSSEHTTAHEELTAYGFPIGLLPSDIQNHSFNHTSGEFEVNIGQHCQITLPRDNYVAAYSTTVTGKMSKNRIDDIEGIRVRAFFRWWSITGIWLVGDDLVFEVGVGRTKFPMKNFDHALACEGRHKSGY